jgi:hypothetical protein
LTPGSTADNDQANARAHYTSTARLLNSIQYCRNWSSGDGASVTSLGISVVILESLLMLPARRFRVVTICASGSALRGRISE